MSALYIYQTLHTVDGSPRNVVEHIRTMQRAAQDVFGYLPDLDERTLTEQIRRLLIENRAPQAVSSFVDARLYADGHCELSYLSASLYNGYALRSLTPTASLVEYDLPISSHPTSARRQIAELARVTAQKRGASVAIQCKSDGTLGLADDSPLFVIKDNTIYRSTEPESVEAELAERAIAMAGLTLQREPVTREQLTRYDELFYFNHIGITSIAHCDSQPYMTILTERIARTLSRL